MAVTLSQGTLKPLCPSPLTLSSDALIKDNQLNRDSVLHKLP